MQTKSLTTLALLLLGTVLSGLSIWFHGATAGWWQYLGYIGVGVLLLAIGEWCATQRLFSFERRGKDVTNGTEQEKAEELDRQREILREELRLEFQRLDQRERQLADKLVAYHQWAEFPPPMADLPVEGEARVELAAKQLDPTANNGNLETTAAKDELPRTDLTVPRTGEDVGPFGSPLPTTESVAELAEKDRQMLALLQKESERLFENIRTNKYSVDGQFTFERVRDDLYQLIRKVAAIYQGHDVENPLLQTSMAHVLRAASRTCLHLLVVLEQLPVKVQDYSLDRLFGYVQQGVKAYSVYKAAEPYWNNWIKPGLLIGRLALGGNPIALGAWWFVGSLSAQGATALTTRVLNRQALALLYNVVRVIGFEVASIYGGQFRYRDANWIYAAELVELICSFAISRDSLSHALREVGGMQLRNEYDRVHFYRCLAEQRSAGPQRIAAREVLTVDQRQAVAHRLERFYKRFVKDRTPSRVERWRESAERRLDVPLVLEESGHRQSAAEQQQEALQALAGYLISAKATEPSQVIRQLTSSRLYREMSYEQQQELEARWQGDPPLSFEPPELPEGSPLIETFLQDLARLAAGVSPRDAESDELAVAAAGYTGWDEAKMRRLLDDAYLEACRQRLPESQRNRKLAAPVARAVLDLLENGDRLRFVYDNVSIESTASRGRGGRGGSPPSDEVGNVPAGHDLWLVGIDDRLVAFEAGLTPRLVWLGDREVIAEQARGYVTHDCRLWGGQWVGQFERRDEAMGLELESAARGDQTRVPAERQATLDSGESPPPSAVPGESARGASCRLRVAGRLHRRYTVYFAPLLEFCGAAADEKPGENP